MIIWIITISLSYKYMKTYCVSGDAKFNHVLNLIISPCDIQCQKTLGIVEEAYLRMEHAMINVVSSKVFINSKCEIEYCCFDE